MCAACAPGQIHVEETPPGVGTGGAPAATPTWSPDTPSPARFSALRDRNCRNYLGGTLLSMMADNVELFSAITAELHRGERCRSSCYSACWTMLARLEPFGTICWTSVTITGRPTAF